MDTGTKVPTKKTYTYYRDLNIEIRSKRKTHGLNTKTGYVVEG